MSKTSGVNVTQFTPVNRVRDMLDWLRNQPCVQLLPVAKEPGAV